MTSVSIHAPTKGATGLLSADANDTPVSIHAPTKGATLPGECWIRCILGFNPRSYERSDRCADGDYISDRCFNPRSYERSDHIKMKNGLLFLTFQSTLLRKERRYITFDNYILLSVSIHAPTKGATRTLFSKVAR